MGELWRTWSNLDALALMPGDIGRAIAAFEEKIGQRVRVIGLNPKNEGLAAEVGDGIQVGYSPGILAWEVRMSATPPVAFVTPEAAQISASGRNKTQTRPITLGRPAKKLPLKKILELNARGLGSREIAKRLERLGVSHMTVSRVLRRAATEGAGEAGNAKQKEPKG